MNLIEISILAIFAGGGAVIGYRMGSLLGAVVGMIAGTLLRYFLGHLLYREAMHCPTCECGMCDYETEYEPGVGIIERCKGCSRVYALRRGNTWCDVRDDGTFEKRMKRTFFGSWKPISK